MMLRPLLCLLLPLVALAACSQFPAVKAAAPPPAGPPPALLPLEEALAGLPAPAADPSADPSAGLSARAARLRARAAALQTGTPAG